ncbi:2OG-Fe(II) oxygenase [Xanthomonas sp. NCPPB 1067]|uniref:2OG-Fe(II) oxygenase n=1 Tax=Xanthomonas sp. NCPPB 1067 TaxID=487524 RepID=UPI001E457AC8|nr:2OG-Fe(II) oxygenase [Xanthomonas sp. NCPPB 1067]MCC4586586.1 2OG-Fe(II) oxygenase [Xanthomonas sp. NCPPB 1067]
MPSAGTTGCVGLHDSDLHHGKEGAASAAPSSQDHLRHFIRTYDNSLPPQLCAKLVESFLTLSEFHERNGRGVRPGLDDSAWTELDISKLSDHAFLSFFRSLISQELARYNADVGLSIAVPDSPLLSPLILKRYRSGSDESFQTHFDSINSVCDRYLVFLWYLNDVSEGGETWFPDLNCGVEPRAGRLLMFPPYWMYAHQGRHPKSGDKYILSTYLRFPQR